METEELFIDKVHHGRNIRRIRRKKGIKQEVLAEKTFLSQQSVSRYEAMREIDDEMLERFANALEVPVDTIKNLEEASSTIIIENNNTFGDNDKISVGNVGEDFDKENVCNFNPIDKVVELYERMLKAEQEKNGTLEKRIAILEQKLDDIK